MPDLPLFAPLPLADADDVLRVLIFVAFGAIWLIAQAIAVAKKRSGKHGKQRRDRIAESIRQYRQEAGGAPAPGNVQRMPTPQEVAAERRRRQQLASQGRAARARTEDDLLARQELRQRQEAQAAARKQAEDNARREQLRRAQAQKVRQQPKQKRRPEPGPKPVPAVATAGSTPPIQASAVGRGRRQPGIDPSAVPAAGHSAAPSAVTLRRLLRGGGARNALVLSEILSPPLSLREQRE